MCHGVPTINEARGFSTHNGLPHETSHPGNPKTYLGIFVLKKILKRKLNTSFYSFFFAGFPPPPPPRPGIPTGPVYVV